MIIEEDNSDAATTYNRTLPIALLRAREAMMDPIREMLASTGLSEQKWRVLRALEDGGPADQSLLAQRTCLLLPSLTRILRSLEIDGLLMRANGIADRRQTIVSITDSGRHILWTHARETKAIFAGFEARYEGDELDQLIALLGKLFCKEPAG